MRTSVIWKKSLYAPLQLYYYKMDFSLSFFVFTIEIAWFSISSVAFKTLCSGIFLLWYHLFCFSRLCSVYCWTTLTDLKVALRRVFICWKVQQLSLLITIWPAQFTQASMHRCSMRWPLNVAFKTSRNKTNGGGGPQKPRKRRRKQIPTCRSCLQLNVTHPTRCGLRFCFFKKN